MTLRQDKRGADVDAESDPAVTAASVASGSVRDEAGAGDDSPRAGNWRERLWNMWIKFYNKNKVVAVYSLVFVATLFLLVFLDLLTYVVSFPESLIDAMATVILFILLPGIIGGSICLFLKLRATYGGAVVWKVVLAGLGGFVLCGIPMMMMRSLMVSERDLLRPGIVFPHDVPLGGLIHLSAAAYWAIRAGRFWSDDLDEVWGDLEEKFTSIPARLFLQFWWIIPIGLFMLVNLGYISSGVVVGTAAWFVFFWPELLLGAFMFFGSTNRETFRVVGSNVLVDVLHLPQPEFLESAAGMMAIAFARLLAFMAVGAALGCLYGLFV